MIQSTTTIDPVLAAIPGYDPDDEQWIDEEAILSGIPGYEPRDTPGDATFYWQWAQFAIEFFHYCLCHVKGRMKDEPFILEPWQQSVTGNLFGWIRPSVLRRYRECLLFVPRGNGKTLWLAGIVNYIQFCDNEPGAELYSAAAEREQARLCFNMVRDQIESSDFLTKQAKLYQHSIVVKGGSYKALSADAHTKHGFNAHLIADDELHAQPNRDLVDVLTTSTGKRDQPLIVHTTTSDFDRPSICNEKHDYAGKVRDGIIENPAFLPVIYEASRDDDWTDPKVWRKANPNIDVSVSMEFLEGECQKAQDSPAFENTFKRLYLNIRTEQETRWLQMDKWDACSHGDTDIAGRSCYGGLDLASTIDIAAFAMAFPGEDGVMDVVCRFWVPEENADKRAKRDRVPYDQWIREGYITATPGNVIDYDVIRRDIVELGTQYDIKEIGADRWNATQIITQLSGDGFEMVEFGQGYKDMSGPTKELEKLVISGKLNHGGNPVLRWMASNVTVEEDAAGNLKPSKKKSTEKIDGIVALVMAIGRATVQNDLTSVYDREERGLLQL